MMTSKEFLNTAENLIQVFISAWIIVYALFRIVADPSSLGNWMMLIVGVLIVLQANWSYRRRKANAKENRR